MKPALLFALTLIMMAGRATSVGGSQEATNHSPVATPASAAAIYAKRCASCHGKNGKAETIKGKLRSARNLTDARWQAEVSDARIFNSIMNGRGKMPGYGKKISEAEIDSLVSYVRGLKK